VFATRSRCTQRCYPVLGPQPSPLAEAACTAMPCRHHTHYYKHHHNRQSIAQNDCSCSCRTSLVMLLPPTFAAVRIEHNRSESFAYSPTPAYDCYELCPCHGREIQREESTNWGENTVISSGTVRQSRYCDSRFSSRRRC